MGKKRCKLSREEYAAKECLEAKYVCKKCNRVAKKVKRLCEPMKIKLEKEK